jgi:hypothetical protein
MPSIKITVSPAIAALAAVLRSQGTSRVQQLVVVPVGAVAVGEAYKVPALADDANARTASNGGHSRTDSFMAAFLPHARGRSSVGAPKKNLVLLNG